MPLGCCLLYVLAGSGALELTQKICRVRFLAQRQNTTGHACDMWPHAWLRGKTCTF